MIMVYIWNNNAGRGLLMNITPETNRQHVSRDNLKTYLRMIDTIFGIDTILSGADDKTAVAKYYKESHPAYRLLHSSKGAVHMALSDDGTFSKEDYIRQSEFVGHIIRKRSCRSVLELGSGNGYNSIYLAHRYPDVRFTGIDLTPVHVRDSRRRSKTLNNVQFFEDDFENPNLTSNSYDLIFAVESLCHSFDLETVLAQAARMLKKGGMIVIFDELSKINPEVLDHDMRTAAELVITSMAVGKERTKDVFMKALYDADFENVTIEDLSENIMPNLLRLQYYSLHFFKRPVRAKIITALLPYHMVQNAVAGLLMPFTVEQKIHGYFRITAEKKGNLSYSSD